MSASAILLCVIALVLIPCVVAYRWYRAWRIQRDLHTDERLRRGMRVLHAPRPDDRSSIDRFRRESSSR